MVFPRRWVRVDIASEGGDGVGGGGIGMPRAGSIGLADGGSKTAEEHVGASARVGIASEDGDGFGGGGSGMPRTGPIGLADDGSKTAKEHVGTSARVVASPLRMAMAVAAVALACGAPAQYAWPIAAAAEEHVGTSALVGIASENGDGFGGGGSGMPRPGRGSAALYSGTRALALYLTFLVAFGEAQRPPMGMAPATDAGGRGSEARHLRARPRLVSCSLRRGQMSADARLIMPPRRVRVQAEVGGSTCTRAHYITSPACCSCRLAQIVDG